MTANVKKLLSLLLCLVMVAGLFPASALAEARTAARVSAGGRIGEAELPVPSLEPRPFEPGEDFDEDAEEPVDYFSVFDEESGINVVVEAPMGALPLLAEVRVQPVDPEAVQDAVEGLMDGGQEILVAMDISFWLGDDEIEPEEPVQVRVAAPELEGATELTLVHLPDEAEPESVELIPDAELAFALGTNEIAFEAESFSVYAVLGKAPAADDLTADGNGMSISMTYNGDPVPDTGYLQYAAHVEGQLSIHVTMPAEAAAKTLVIQVPTGWKITKYSAVEGTPAINGVDTITIDNEYAPYVASSKLEAYNDGASTEQLFGDVTVTGTDWTSQLLTGYDRIYTIGEYTFGKVRTFGGTITYTFTENAGTVNLNVNLIPQAELFVRNTDRDVGKVLLPDVKAVLTCGTETCTKSFSCVATDVAVQKLYLMNRSMNVGSGTEGRSDRITIQSAAAGWSTLTGLSTAVRLLDNFTIEISYPEGVFYDGCDDGKGGTNYLPDEVSVEEDPVLGGGKVILTGHHKALRHNYSNPQFSLYFYAKTGEGYQDGATKTWLPGETIPFTVTKAEAERAGYTGITIMPQGSANVGLKTWNRTIIDSGNNFDIQIPDTHRNRTDLEEKYGYEEDFALAGTTMTCGYSYSNVHFRIVNMDNKLGLTGLHLLGENVHDVVVITTTGRRIEIGAINQQNPTSADNKSEWLYPGVKDLGDRFSLAEGEYIAECTYTADVMQGTYDTTMAYHGFSSYGKFVNGQEGGLEISVLDQAGNVAVNAEGEPIIGHATVTPQHVRIVPGTFSYMVTQNKETGIDDFSATDKVTLFYPGDTIYYKMRYVSSYGTLWSKPELDSQNTLIDPKIVIALPEGIELDTSSVEAWSPAGNHGDEVFPLVQEGTAYTRTVDGIPYRVYTYVVKDPLDLVARDHWYPYQTPVAPSKETRFVIRYRAKVLSNCPQYTIDSYTGVMMDVGPDVLATDNTCELTEVEENWGENGYGLVRQRHQDVTQYFIKPLIGLNMNLEIRPQNSSLPYRNYTGAENSIVKVQEGQPAEVKFSYESTSESESYKNTDIYLPIPKEGTSYHYLTNLADNVVDNTELHTFAFSMDLMGAVNMVSSDNTPWTTYYAVDAVDNPVKYDDVPEAERDSWEPVIVTRWYTAEELTAAGKTYADVVMLKFHAEDDIEPHKTGKLEMRLMVDPTAEFDTLDFWRGYGRHSLGNNRANWETTPIIAATPTSATMKGVLFIDQNKDGAYVEDAGTNEKLYGGGKFSAVLSRDDGKMENVAVTMNSDGTFEIMEGNYPYYLRKGNYTLTLTRAVDETHYSYELVESETASAWGGSFNTSSWYNDVKNQNVHEPTAKIFFTVDKSGTLVENVFTPEIYAFGVGLSEPYFFVYHSGDNTVEKIYMSDERVTSDENGFHFDIANETKDTFLYGGYYSRYSGVSDNYNSQALSYDETGWSKDEGGTPYGGAKAVWKGPRAYTENGLQMAPKVGETYYLKEVPEVKYLQPYLHYTYKKPDGEITRAWAISAIDDLNYQQAGFVILDANNKATICDTLAVTAAGSNSTVILKPETVFRSRGVTEGYLDYLQVYDWDGEGNLLQEGGTILQYWVTPDGLMVTGVTSRVVTQITNKNTITRTDTPVKSTIETFSGN